MMTAMRGTTVPPPATDDASSLALFRSLLETAPFEAGSIQELLGTESGVLTRPRDYPVHLRRIATDESALAMLTRLFLLLAEVDVVSADQALAPLGVEGLERLRLVETLDDRVRATVRIVPHGRLVLASDLPGLVGAEHVAGIHGPSATLGHLTVRRPVARALDVATGSGIQALLAARHAERVVATDVNERALAFAAFNVAVNGVDNVELRHGSFFEPVLGERFGLVVCNPPYVVSPDSEYLFRDSGLGGDRVSSELVGALPSLLEDGAFGSIMVSWIQDEVDEPADRPRRWLEGSGCDTWILHSSTDDALATAAGWHRDAATADEYGERIDRWLDYYRREGIAAVSYGAIVMRRRVGGGNWVRSTRLPSGRVGPADAHLRRLFAAQDALADLTADDALLDRRLALVDRVALEQELAVHGGQWAPRSITLVLEEGIGFRAGLDRTTTAIVRRLDGARTLREILLDAAAELNVPVADLEQAGAALARQLLELGFAVLGEEHGPVTEAR
jgi:hypothetical protein